jgi:hypothetical protein
MDIPSSRQRRDWSASNSAKPSSKSPGSDKAEDAQ